MSVGVSEAQLSKAYEYIRRQHYECEVPGPFGSRKVLYADYTASGRALKCIEEAVYEYGVTNYGNVHTASSWTGLQSTSFREEAREMVRHYVNADHRRSVLFTGDGCTGALQRLLHFLTQVHENEVMDPRLFEDTRWGTISCQVCSTTLKNETELRRHCLTSEHISNAKTDKQSRGPTLIHIVVDPSSHHSLLLPMRHREDCCSVVTSVLPFNSIGLADLTTVPALLDEVIKANPEHCVIQIVCLSHTSNITGLVSNIASTCSAVHKRGGFVIMDAAASFGHVKLDLTPSSGMEEAPDVLVFSPHKMIGGISTPGVLVITKSLLRTRTPINPGGGTVLWVDEERSTYTRAFEDREEAGTPNTIGAIRLGLVLRMYNHFPTSSITKRENELKTHMLNGIKQNRRIMILGPLSDDLESVNSVSMLFRYGNKMNPLKVEKGNFNNHGGLYLHSNFVCSLLSDIWGVQTRAGCACAGPQAMHLLGINGSLQREYEQALSAGELLLRPSFVRISISPFMNFDDIEKIILAINWVANYGWLLLPFYEMDVYSGNWEPKNNKFYKRRKQISDFRLLECDRKYGFSCESSIEPKKAETVEAPTAKKLPHKMCGAVPTMNKNAMSELTAMLAGGIKKSPKARPKPKPKHCDVAPKALSEFEKIMERRRGPSSDDIKSNVSEASASIEAPIIEATEKMSSGPSFQDEGNHQMALETQYEEYCENNLEGSVSIEKKTSFQVEESQSKVEDRPVDSLTAAHVPNLLGKYEVVDGPEDEELEELNKANSNLLDAVKTLLVRSDISTSTKIPAKLLYSNQRHLLWFALSVDTIHSMVNSVDEAAPCVMETVPPHFWSDVATCKRSTDAPFSPLLFEGKDLYSGDSYTNDFTSVKPNVSISVKPSCRVVESTTRKRPSIVLEVSNDETLMPMPKAQLVSHLEGTEDIEEPTEDFEPKVVDCNGIENEPKQETEGLADWIEDESHIFNISVSEECGDAGVKEVTPITLVHPPMVLRRAAGNAIAKFDMIKDGDRILVGVSGGKDSYSLLHILRSMQKWLPMKFEIAAANVDPMTPEYDPSPIQAYVESLGIKFHSLRKPIVELAKEYMQKLSFCSFCSRMKRGMLSQCMQEEGYNVLALGQHLDDIGESFLMSLFQNARLNTMKANYTADRGFRVIRPLVLCREKDLASFAAKEAFPVIPDNCPLCFANPKERQRMKVLLAEQEYLHPDLFSKLARGLEPLLAVSTTHKQRVTGIDTADQADKSSLVSLGVEKMLDSTSSVHGGVVEGHDEAENKGKIMIEGEEDGGAALLIDNSGGLIEAIELDIQACNIGGDCP